MKKILMLKAFLLMQAITAVTACSGGDSDGSPSGNATITLSQESLTVPAVGGTYTIDVSTTAREWGTFSYDTSWFAVKTQGSTSQSGTITIIVDENKGSARTGTIYVKSGGTQKVITVAQASALQVETTQLFFNSIGETLDVAVTVENFTATADAEWITTSKSGTTLHITAAANDALASRKGNVTVSDGHTSINITINQESAEDREMNIPAGYHLAWHDEFNEGTTLSSDWRHEVQNAGWVNHELQNYVNGSADGKRVTELVDGKLNINCFKGSDGKIYSGRVYAKSSTGWQYGYIEARMKLPKGKGTWPAFWMMPVNFKSWPADGEIDIMEEVGYHPNYVSSSLHANAHVHSNGTQVTHEMLCDGAEDDFHVYAMEWTADNITTYVDGKVQLRYDNRGLGRDDWPYDAPFYIILNLAWGGDWGGAQGVDESALPCTMKVDYVRVFQKN